VAALCTADASAEEQGSPADEPAPSLEGTAAEQPSGPLPREAANLGIGLELVPTIGESVGVRAVLALLLRPVSPLLITGDIGLGGVHSQEIGLGDFGAPVPVDVGELRIAVGAGPAIPIGPHELRIGSSLVAQAGGRTEATAQALEELGVAFTTKSQLELGYALDIDLDIEARQLFWLGPRLSLQLSSTVARVWEDWIEEDLEAQDLAVLQGSATALLVWPRFFLAAPIHQPVGFWFEIGPQFRSDLFTDSTRTLAATADPSGLAEGLYGRRAVDVRLRVAVGVELRWPAPQ